MARPIKETPVLKGAEAVRFRKNLEVSQKQQISPDEKERLKKNFELFKARSNF
ncbi:hypothetical protein [Dyadobacter sp. CY323]|uniref:hypothetical protein n=1 Tax=Dyadobacter sp. CY323 TaxID=2907302 RepID=UPI001F1736E3|nr:hypothetical protein [Dyadobacter sp. CY323]MCE6991001.1 hypothetical protein [Dyadobacter sp. CY323]